MAQIRETELKVAIKFMKLKNESEKMFNKETDLMKKLDNGFVIQIYGYDISL